MIRQIVQACLPARSTAWPLIMALTLRATPVLAHPGHGAEGGSYSVSHYLTTPGHWAAALAVALLAGIAWKVIAASRRRWAAAGRRAV